MAQGRSLSQALSSPTLLTWMSMSMSCKVCSLSLLLENPWNVLSVRKFDSTGSVKGQSCSFYKSNERYQSVSEAVITAPYLPQDNDHRVFILHTEVCHQYLWMLQSSLWHILAGCDNECFCIPRKWLSNLQHSFFCEANLTGRVSSRDLGQTSHSVQLPFKDMFSALYTFVYGEWQFYK